MVLLSCSLLYSSKNPEEAELEDILNSVVRTVYPFNFNPLVSKLYSCPSLWTYEPDAMLWKIRMSDKQQINVVRPWQALDLSARHA